VKTLRLQILILSPIFKVVVDKSDHAVFVVREYLEQSAANCDQRSPLDQIKKMKGLVLSPSF